MVGASEQGASLICAAQARRSVLERLLRARLVYSRAAMARALSFEYLNRQLVWHELSELLLFLLPLVNVGRLKAAVMARLPRLGPSVTPAGVATGVALLYRVLACSSHGAPAAFWAVHRAFGHYRQSPDIPGFGKGMCLPCLGSLTARLGTVTSLCRVLNMFRNLECSADHGFERPEDLFVAQGRSRRRRPGLRGQPRRLRRGSRARSAARATCWCPTRRAPAGTASATTACAPTRWPSRASAARAAARALRPCSPGARRLGFKEVPIARVGQRVGARVKATQPWRPEVILVRPPLQALGA